MYSRIFHANISSEFFGGIFLLNISFWNDFIYRVCILALHLVKLYFTFQQDYQLDSFIQYVGCQHTVRTRDRSLRAHYIGFHKMGDDWFHFNDAVIHKVNLLRSYCINLIIYRLENIEAYEPSMDLSGIPQLGKSVALNKRANSYITSEDNTGNINNGGSVNSAGSSRRGTPALINNDNDNVPMLANNTEPRPELPLYIQPSHRHKDFIVYFAPDSQSSGEEAPPNRTHPDDDYMLPKNFNRYPSQ